MQGSWKRRWPAVAVLASCLAGCVVFAIAFHWFIYPTVAKNHTAVAKAPASVTVAAPETPASPNPTAQLRLPSRFVRQPPPSPVPEVRPPSKSRASATAAAADSAVVAPRPAPRKPVARTTVRQERPSQRDPWGDYAWSG